MIEFFILFFSPCIENVAIGTRATMYTGYMATMAGLDWNGYIPFPLRNNIGRF